MKEPTTINAIPPEVSFRFLLGINPLTIKELRSLCRTFYIATSSASFALANLQILYPITIPEYGLRRAYLTKDFFYWDRYHQRELANITKCPYFSFVDKNGESVWSHDMKFSLPLDADPASRIRAFVPVIWSKAFMIQILLDNNAFVGSIPPELGQEAGLSQLTSLSLSGNLLSGRIPPELGNLSSLCHLNLSKNMLDGCIPEELGKLETLWTLNLSENRLEGTIPNQVLSNCAMKELLVSKNLLCGVLSEIDVEGWRKLMLEVFDLSGNALQGNIPSRLCDFDDLRILNLSCNQLTGSIPADLGRLEKLEIVDLSNNLLDGVIPDGLMGGHTKYLS